MKTEIKKLILRRQLIFVDLWKIILVFSFVSELLFNIISNEVIEMFLRFHFLQSSFQCLQEPTLCNVHRLKFRLLQVSV